MLNRKRVVVTGIGALTPLGNSKDEFWKNLIRGVSGADFITHFDPEKFRTKFACELKNFNAEDHFERKEIRKLDPFSQYALVAAQEAVDDCGIDLETIDRSRAGVIWASGIGGLKTFQDEVFGYLKGGETPRFSPFFITKMIIDIAAGHISMRFGFRGVNYATVSACASSSNSIAEAFNYIRAGKTDLMVTGGSEASIFEAAIGGFNAMRALSERNDDPKTASRPFDKGRDGFVMGEGGCALILEELEHAKARGAKIYAEVKGSGMSADAYHITAPNPEGEGAAIVMHNAFEDSGMGPADIDYINVHGTSTPLGDIAELKAIEKAFGENAKNILISSTKSMTGHLLGAAGAVEAISCILALYHGEIPPTINHFEDDEEINPNLNIIYHNSVKKDIRGALSNTFGFGGHNASLIFSKFED